MEPRSTGTLYDSLDNKMLASFVPTLLLKELENGVNLQMPSSQQYESVALFADISGFSQLNEYFAQLGGVGLGQMMALVNVYFQKMIKICSSCGGDVIKFAGDALIVLWVNEPLTQLAHRACECALELQESLHDAEMTQEISLSLKVGLGLGSATMFYVGGDNNRFEYFAAGPALRECFSAADAAEKGDVIVTSPVFKHVQHACTAERMSDGHYSVVEMRQTFRKKALSRGMPALTPQALAVLRSYAPPVLLYAAELETQLKQTVRSWTVSVVQASIIFIHFGIEGVMDLLALDCAKIHKAIVTVQRLVHSMQGRIHRFTVDDKGCVMKVVFGADLPHEDQPYRALLTALNLRQALSLQGIQPAFGVASGASLVGPVGGVVRQEFTVHGDRVVLAARLMQLAAKLGGMVLCDEETHDATRDDIRFVRLRPVNIKGRTGPYRPYRPVASSEILEKPTRRDLPEAEYYLSPEASTVQAACGAWMADGSERAGGAGHAAGCRVMVINGAHGAGKTQLLMQSRVALERRCKVVHVRCRAHEQGDDGCLARRLCAQLCGYDVWASLKYIIPLLSTDPAKGPLAAGEEQQEHQLHAELQLMCDARWWQRATHDRPAVPASLGSSRNASPAARGGARGGGVRGCTSPCGLEVESRSEFGMDMEAAPVEEESCDGAAEGISGTRLALLIDDLHHADQHSCKLLQKLAVSTTGRPGPLLLLLASRDERASLSKRSGAEKRVSDGRRLAHALASQPHSLRVQLLPLSSEACGRLFCATLGVDGMPLALVDLFVRRAGGSPLLCQVITRMLYAKELLEIDPQVRSCQLTERATAASMEAIATATIVATSHLVMHVRLASLKLLAQIILKVMSLLPGSCSLSQLHQALPIPLGLDELAEEIQDLRSRQIVQLKPRLSADRRSMCISPPAQLTEQQSPPRASPPQARRGTATHVEMRMLSKAREALSMVAPAASAEEQFEFADIGMREVCVALMVDAQKRQVRSCLQAAQRTCCTSFEFSGGDDGSQSATPSPLAPPAQLSAGSEEASFTRRQHARLTHESSMSKERQDRQAGDAPASWRDGVLAITCRRDPREPSHHSQLRYSGGDGGDGSQHGAASFGWGSFGRPTKGVEGQTSPNRSFNTPSPLRRTAPYSPLRLSNWWGRKDRAKDGGKGGGKDGAKDGGKDNSFGSFGSRPSSKARSPPPAATKYPKPVRSPKPLSPLSVGLPLSPPRHRLIRNVLPPPTPTPSSPSRFSRGVDLIARGQFVRTLRAGQKGWSPGKPPKGWRQVQPHASESETMCIKMAGTPEASETASETASGITSLSASNSPERLRLPPSIASCVSPPMPRKDGPSQEDCPAREDGVTSDARKPSSQPHAARKLVFTGLP